VVLQEVVGRAAHGRRLRLELHTVVALAVVVLASPVVVVLGAGLGGTFGAGVGVGRRHARGVGLSADVLRVGQFVVLLPLHPPVLEPDLDLALGQHQRMRYLDAPSPRQVPVVVELLLELEDLVAGVGGPLPLGLHARLERAIRCNTRGKRLVRLIR